MDDERLYRKIIARSLVTVWATGLFITILFLILSGAASAFDDPVRQFFYGLRDDSLTNAVIVITSMADKYFIIALCIILLIIPYTRFRFGVPLSAGALGIIIVNSLIKHTITRPRPSVVHLVEETGYSFPSGHSITSFLFYGLAIWLVNRYVDNIKVRVILTIVLAIPMLLVGPTRIYLGVHYPTDVVGAWCLASIGIVIIISVIEYLDYRKHH